MSYNELYGNMINISKGELSDPLGDSEKKGLTLVRLLGDPFDLNFIIN